MDAMGSSLIARKRSSARRGVASGCYTQGNEAVGLTRIVADGLLDLLHTVAAAGR